MEKDKSIKTKHTIQELQALQALPLDVKVRKTKQRIREWYEYWNGEVYVSFSGGKDSTVLLHLVREMYPDVQAVFVDMGLEYPEIREFVRTFDNVEWLKPKMNFKQVCKTYGYPFISKEVSECVPFAKKYLTRLIEEDSLARTKEIGYHAYRKLCSIGEYAKPTDSGGKDNSPILSNTKRLLEQGVIPRDNRTQRLLGIYTISGQATKLEDIPNEEKDRSMFSCERYSFLLDAPFPISNKCCMVMKKGPTHEFQKKTGKKAMTGQMASESRLRKQQWLNNGCNGFQMKLPVSNPLSFWFEQDVLAYIYENKIPIAPPYGEVVKENEVEGQLDFADLWMCDIGKSKYKTTGCNRTGCIFCGYGAHLEKKGEGRFERLKVTHPKIYEFVFKPEEEGGLGYKEKIDWLNENGKLHIRY